MGEINQVLGGHGAGRELAGFTFFRPNLREMGKFEEWLEDEARREVLKWKELLEPAEYAQAVTARGLLIDNGRWSWSTQEGTPCGDKLQTPEGKCRLLWMIASRKKAVKLEDIEQAYTDFQPEFDELVQSLLKVVPNTPPPAARATEETASQPSASAS